jgi:hypothetical protein
MVKRAGIFLTLFQTFIFLKKATFLFWGNLLFIQLESHRYKCWGSPNDDTVNNNLKYKTDILYKIIANDVTRVWHTNP